MIHIHYHKKAGDWTGYYGLKICRCGHTKLYDLYGTKWYIDTEAITKRLKEML